MPSSPHGDKGQWAGILCRARFWGGKDEMWLDMSCEKT